jgi:hypothetical protein
LGPGDFCAHIRTADALVFADLGAVVKLADAGSEGFSPRLQSHHRIEDCLSRRYGERSERYVIGVTLTKTESVVTVVMAIKEGRR